MSEARGRPLYQVTERFSAADGERWRDYVEWSRLTQLTEIVFGDLSPSILKEIADDDWPHIVNESFLLDWFTDLDWLLRRVGNLDGRNLICAFLEPDEQPVPPPGPHDFQFEGYDLIDRTGGISALTNCGGFDLAFANGELTPQGLLPSLARAREVQRDLRHHYPDEHHADCHVWAVFRAR